MTAADERDAAILRQAIDVLRRRDWPGQAMLTALAGELEAPVTAPGQEKG